MGLRRFAIVLAALAPACSLFVSIDGLSNGPATDGGLAGDAPVLGDGGIDSGFSNLGDGGMDAGSQYARAILSDGPIGYWHLDDPAGSTTIRDEVNNNAHPGTIVGAVVLGVPGIDKTAAQFDGTTSCIDLGPNFIFPAPAPFSMEAWVNPTGAGGDAGFPGYQWVISTEVNASSGLRDGWSLVIAPSGQADLEGWSSTSGSSVFIIGAYAQNSPGGGLVANTWVQIDTTYDGNGVAEIWIDGTLRDHATEPGGLDSMGALSFGCRAATNPTALFKGELDEISIFDKVLTSDQILAHQRAHTAK